MSSLSRLSPFLIALLLFTASCRHQPVLDNAPQVSFAKDVQPIIDGNCTQSGCHGSERRRSLVTYDDVINYGEISKGDARNSRLYLAITGKGGNRIMPPSPATPLTDNQIVLIYLWIEEGAQNN